MDFPNILAWLAFGIVAPIISHVAWGKKSLGCGTNLILGLGGSVLGGVIAELVINQITEHKWTVGWGLQWPSFAAAAVVSILAMVLAGLFLPRSHRR